MNTNDQNTSLKTSIGDLFAAKGAEKSKADKKTEPKKTQKEKQNIRAGVKLKPVVSKSIEPLAERSLEVAPPANLFPVPLIPEKPVFHNKMVLGGGRLKAKIKHFELLAKAAVMGQLKPVHKESDEGVLCAFDQKYKASGEHFVVYSGQLFYVSVEYAEAAKTMNTKSLDKKAFHANSVGRLILILEKDAAIELQLKDQEFEAKRAGSTKEDEIFKEKTLTWFRANEKDVNSGTHIYAFPEGGFKNPDTLAEYEEYLKSADIKDLLNPSGRITSVVVFGGITMDVQEEDEVGNKVVLPNTRLFRVAFISGRTSKVLRDSGVKSVYGIWTDDDKGQQTLFLSSLSFAREIFFPQSKKKPIPNNK